MLGNDSDADGDSLTAMVATGPAHGALTLNADGSFSYTPDANYHGADSFTYRANDGVADSAEATVTLTINPVNDAPVASGDAYTTDEDTALVIAAAGLLGNDSDVDGGGADGGAGQRPGERHAGVERRRQLHLHAGLELQRRRQLYLQGQRRLG